MSAVVESTFETADAAAGNIAPTLPMRKRKKTDEEPVPGATPEPELKVMKEDWVPEATTNNQPTTTDSVDSDDLKPVKRGPMSKAREVRLEQNRKAAKESRRRKKVMIEELQRSVIFFSRANSTLKQQNDEFSRVLMQAQSQVALLEGGQQQQKQQQEKPAQPQQAEQNPPSAINATVKVENDQQAIQQAQAQAVATQAMYETQGFPTAAARAAAQTMNAGPAPAAFGGVAQSPTPAGSQQQLPPMQPGATMQAMANFQQAAAAAMQVAMQGMQGIAGMGLIPMPPPPSAQAQQAYQETMAAFAMQQAAAAAAGQQFAVLGMPPGAQFMNQLAWQATMPQQQQQQAPQQQQQASVVAAPAQAGGGDQPATQVV